jgi:hypothetical protein
MPLFSFLHSSYSFFWWLHQILNALESGAKNYDVRNSRNMQLLRRLIIPWDSTARPTIVNTISRTIHVLFILENYKHNLRSQSLAKLHEKVVQMLLYWCPIYYVPKFFEKTKYVWTTASEPFWGHITKFLIILEEFFWFEREF